MEELEIKGLDSIIDTVSDSLGVATRGLLVLSICHEEEVYDVYEKLRNSVGEDDALSQMEEVIARKIQECIENALFSEEKEYISELRNLIAS